MENKNTVEAASTVASKGTDLSKDFDAFVTRQNAADHIKGEVKPQSKFKELVDDTQRYLIFNREKVELVTGIAKTLTQFAIHKTPFTLFEGAMEVVRNAIMDKTYYATDFFCEANGWKPFAYDGMQFQGIFTSVLNRFPSKGLKFEYDSGTSARLIDLPFCKMGMVNNHGTQQVFYQFNDVDIEKLVDFLVGEKLKELGTNIISLDFSSNRDDPGVLMTLIPEIIFPVPSPKADFYTDYFKKCLDLNVNRSIMFHGPPGTGKTTLCQTIINNLGFRTLKFRYTSSYDYSLFAFVVRKFKIEAVMIDDFDQCDSRDELLEFLEMLKKETKVVIGLANSLREFHPALLRPGRFDEIVTIDALAPLVVKEILGPKLTRSYFSKVKGWPVAYLNEFVTRSRILDKDGLKESYAELSIRVAKNLEGMKY